MALNIKDIRIVRGLTQKDVAQMAGLSLSYLTEIEQGKKTANLHRLEAIARALGVSTSMLLDDPAHNKTLRKLLAQKPVTYDQDVADTASIMQDLAPKYRKVLAQTAKSLAAIS